MKIFKHITAFLAAAVLFGAGAAITEKADFPSETTVITASAEDTVQVGTVQMKSSFTCTTTAVRINWNKVSGATGYRVYRYNSSTGAWNAIATITSGDTLTYLDSGTLSAGTTYKYKVKAYKKINGVVYWGTASATLSTVTKPAQVTTKSSFTCTTTAVRINWNKVSGATGYRVYRYNSSTGAWTAIATITSGDTLTYRDSGPLSAGTTYKYKVKAYIKLNGVVYWGAASSTLSTVTKPAQVTTKSSFTCTTTAVRINWNKVTGATGYRVYRYNSSTGAWTAIATITSGSTVTYRDGNTLSAGTTYKYKVKAYKKLNGVVYWGAASATFSASTKATTPVAIHGQLSVKGANIVDQNGNIFKIKGMSTHGIMWEDFSDILSTASLKVLRDDWGVNTIRIAMYTEEWGGYTTGSTYAAQAKQKVSTGVENAKSLGMYAIIDWHILSDGDPRTHQAEAVSFFTEMAQKYKDYNNVIYEICNEPNGSVTWSGGIKSYCQTVVNAIRKYDTDAIIICGTGTWSQDIDQVVGNRLSDPNCVYALHFYANTHTDWLRNRVQSCYNSGLPILVSEFGTCDASGNGGFNESQTKTWLTLLDSLNIGYINWSAANKSETASAFLAGTDLSAIKAGTSQLTQSGILIRSWFRTH